MYNFLRSVVILCRCGVSWSKAHMMQRQWPR